MQPAMYNIIVQFGIPDHSIHINQLDDKMLKEHLHETCIIFLVYVYVIEGEGNLVPFLIQNNAIK